MEIIEAKESLDKEVRGFVSTLSLEINTREDYVKASEILKEIKRRIKTIDDRLEPEKAKAYAAYQGWLNLIKELKGPYLEKEMEIKGHMLSWDREQEHIRREAEEKAREEARRIAEEEKLRMAIAVEATGEKEIAETILNSPVEVPPIIIPRPEKVEGISSRGTWKFKVVDPDLVPREFLKIDDVKLGQYGRAMKESARVPGVEFYLEKSIAARG